MIQVSTVCPSVLKVYSDFRKKNKIFFIIFRKGLMHKEEVSAIKEALTKLLVMSVYTLNTGYPRIQILSQDKE
jgi:hypothetical protein